MKFLTGVNYWPRRKAMYWWQRFDAGEVRDEFAEIASWQLDLVRIMLMWEDFQPEPFRMSGKCLRNLGIVLEAADEVGLRVIPSLFVGHMSGINFTPAWALGPTAPPGVTPTWAGGGPVDRQPADIYSSPALLRAQVFGLRAVIGAHAGHPAVYSWNITNEHDNFLQPASADAAWLWNLLLCDEARRADPHRPVTAGLHIEDYDRYHNFRSRDMAEGNDYLSIHGYALYTRWARTARDVVVVPFGVALARALAPGKTVMAEEFGLCTTENGGYSALLDVKMGARGWRQFLANDEEAREYYDGVGRQLVEHGAIGALAWCFSDYDRCLYDTPPFNVMVHERWFGVSRADGRPKPCLEALRLLGLQQVTSPPLLAIPQNYEDDPAAHFRRLFADFAKNIPAPPALAADPLAQGTG